MNLLERIKMAVDKKSVRAWKRKLTQINKLYKTLLPIQKKIDELEEKKLQKFDEITVLKMEMAIECPHLSQYLSVVEDHMECAFCKSKLYDVQK